MKKISVAIFLTLASFSANASKVDELINANRLEEANKAVEAEIASQPNASLTWLDYAKLMLAKNDNQKAWAGLSQARKLMHGSLAEEAKYYQIEGAWYFQKKDFNKAEWSFRQSLKFEENNLETNLLLISTLLANHQLKPVEGLTAKLASLYPSDKTVNYLYQITHPFEKNLRILMKKEPSLWAPEMLLIDQYIQKGEFVTAQKVLNEIQAEELEQFPFVLFFGQTALSLKQPKEIIKKLSSITQAKDDYRLLGLLSSAYFSLGNMEKASTFFESSLKARDHKELSAPEPAIIPFLQHNVAYLDKLIIQAYTQTKSTATLPGLVKIAYYFKKDQLINAKQEAIKWVHTYPGQAFSYDVLGSVYKAEGDYHSAETAFHSAIKLDETYLPARLHLIDILIKQRKYHEARVLLENTTKHFKPDSKIYLLWSKLEEFEGNRDAAKKWLEKAASLTQSLEPGLEFVSFYLRQNRPQLALLLAENLVKYYGNDNRLLTLLGGLYLEKTHNYQKATEIYQKLVVFYPDSPGMVQNLSKSYQLSGHPESAIKALEQYTQKYPHHIEVKKQLASLYLHHKNMDKAKISFEQVLKEYPEDYVSLNNLANLYIEIEPKKSLAFARQAYALAENNAAICDTLGWAYYKNNNITKALSFLKKAHDLDKNLGEATYHLAILYREQGQNQTAMLFLKQALASTDMPFSSRTQATKLLNHWLT